MIENEFKTVKEKRIKDVKCNKCETSMYGEESREWYGAHVYVTGQYDSPHIDDMEEIEFDLCEKCILELIKTFKIPAKRKTYHE